MLGNKPVAATVPVTDLDRAKKFYCNTLGLSVSLEVPGANQLKSGAATLTLYLTQDNAGKSPATCASWKVDDIEAEVDELTSKGVTFEQYEDLGTDGKGIASQGPVKAAWFKDPDGNILGIMQSA